MHQLSNEFSDIVKGALKEVEQSRLAPSDWISAKDAFILLGVKSRSSLSRLREAKEITYTQAVNSKIILYSRSSCLDYLERNRHPSKYE